MVKPKQTAMPCSGGKQNKTKPNAYRSHNSTDTAAHLSFKNNSRGAVDESEARCKEESKGFGEKKRVKDNERTRKWVLENAHTSKKKRDISNRSFLFRFFSFLFWRCLMTHHDAELCEIMANCR